MKFAVAVLACVVVAANGQFNNYRKPSSVFNTFQSQFQRQPYRPIQSVAVNPAPVPAPTNYARVVGDARSANTVKYGNEVNPDGSYNYFYETDNSIAAQEQGTPRNLGGNPPVAPVVVQGSYSYTSPEGVPVAISYVADENGYQPVGSVIPTPHPIPEQIARALEYIARTAPRQ